MITGSGHLRLRHDVKGPGTVILRSLSAAIPAVVRIPPAHPPASRHRRRPAAGWQAKYVLHGLGPWVH